MSYNTQALLLDKNNKPIPQYYDPTSDSFKPLSNQIIAQITDGSLSTLGAKADVPVLDPSAPASTNQVLKAILAQLQGSGNGNAPVELTGSIIEDVVLQTEAVATGNGMPYTPTNANMTLNFEITGTSTSRTIIFEIAGASGVYQAHPGYKLGDITYTPATQTTGGSDTAPETWEVDIPVGWSFRARISSIAGGNISIAGKAVMQ